MQFAAVSQREKKIVAAVVVLVVQVLGIRKRKAEVRKEAALKRSVKPTFHFDGVFARLWLGRNCTFNRGRLHDNSCKSDGGSTNELHTHKPRGTPKEKEKEIPTPCKKKKKVVGGWRVGEQGRMCKRASSAVMCARIVRWTAAWFHADAKWQTFAYMLKRNTRKTRTHIVRSTCNKILPWGPFLNNLVRSAAAEEEEEEGGERAAGMVHRAASNRVNAAGLAVHERRWEGSTRARLLTTVEEGIFV